MPALARKLPPDQDRVQQAGKPGKAQIAPIRTAGWWPSEIHSFIYRSARG